MPYPREFKKQSQLISAGQLNELVKGVRDLQDKVRDDNERQGVPGGRVLGKIIGYDSASGSYSWDEWEIYDGEPREKPGGLQGRIEGFGGWTDPTQFPARELNDSPDAAADSLVWMEPTVPTINSGELPDLNYRFAVGSSKRVYMVHLDGTVDGDGLYNAKIVNFGPGVTDYSDGDDVLVLLVG